MGTGLKRVMVLSFFSCGRSDLQYSSMISQTLRGSDSVVFNLKELSVVDMFPGQVSLYSGSSSFLEMYQLLVIRKQISFPFKPARRCFEAYALQFCDITRTGADKEPCRKWEFDIDFLNWFGLVAVRIQFILTMI